jgi:zinc transporter 7
VFTVLLQINESNQCRAQFSQPLQLPTRVSLPPCDFDPLYSVASMTVAGSGSASWAAWQSAMLSTFLISSFPNIFLYLVPAGWLSSKKGDWLNVQHILLAFASGGLLGDVLLHAIPHLMAPHGGDVSAATETPKDEEGAAWNFMESCTLSNMQAEDGCSAHDTRSLVIGSLVLGGFLFFFTAERLITSYLTPHCHHGGGATVEAVQPNEESNNSDVRNNNTISQHQDFSILTVKDLREECRMRNLERTGRKGDLIERLKQICDSDKSERASPALVSAMEVNDTLISIDSSEDVSESAFYESLSASGWLNISADFMHNFTDGLAMGASHASGDGTLALAATLSIFFHEVPHEIGDFTILIESGMRWVLFVVVINVKYSLSTCMYFVSFFSKNNAIRMQFFTSAGAFLGTIIGMLASSLHGWDEYLIAFTSGGFLYVATVSLIPTVLNKPQLGEASSAGQIMQIVLESLFFALGVGMMVIVSLLEGEGGHHH